MHSLKAIIDFSKFENDVLDELSGTIKSKLNTNSGDFPDLPVDVATLGGHITTYHNILIAPLYSGKSADLKAARKVLKKDLKKNGVYVNQVAEGDEVLLAKSGYPLSKVPAPIGQLVQARFKKVTSITKGFEIEIEKVPNAEGYLVLTCPSSAPAPADFSDWSWHYFPKTKGTIDTLNSSTKYRIVCVGLGTDPNLNFSEPMERTTQ